ITERKNVLSGLLYLSAALAYWQFDDIHESNRDRPRSEAFGWYGLSLVLFVLALLSKSVTCSLPAALILMHLWQRRKLTIVHALSVAPMFAIGLILALNTARIEREHVGAEGIDFAFTLAERLLIATRSLLFYPGKILGPWPIMFIYPR